MKQTVPIYLASASPRRREILSMLGLAFTVEVSEADESIDSDVPEEIVKTLAGRKAMAVALHHADEDCLVIGSDTIVWKDGKALGKPADDEEAKRMIQSLEGDVHTVYTGVCLARCRNGEITETRFADAADVEFAPMSEDEVDWYVSTGESRDKAGAYAIQGLGGRFVKAIRGDYYTVMGLPMCSLYEKIREIGVLVQEKR